MSDKVRDFLWLTVGARVEFGSPDSPSLQLYGGWRPIGTIGAGGKLNLGTTEDMMTRREKNVSTLQSFGDFSLPGLMNAGGGFGVDTAGIVTSHLFGMLSALGIIDFGGKIQLHPTQNPHVWVFNRFNIPFVLSLGSGVELDSEQQASVRLFGKFGLIDFTYLTPLGDDSTGDGDDFRWGITAELGL